MKEKASAIAVRWRISSKLIFASCVIYTWYFKVPGRYLVSVCMNTTDHSSNVTHTICSCEERTFSGRLQSSIPRDMINCMYCSIMNDKKADQKVLKP